MADFTQTVTNTIQVFGSADTENWNEIVWGTDNWAADDDMEFEITKLLANTCLLYTSPSPRDRTRSRMPSSA